MGHPVPPQFISLPEDNNAKQNKPSHTLPNDNNMENLTKYSLVTLLRAASQNRQEISDYLRGRVNDRCNTRYALGYRRYGKGFDPDIDATVDVDNKILGLSPGIFIGVLAFAVLFWFGVVIFFIVRFKKLQSWAQVVGIICLLPVVPFGLLITLIVSILGVEPST